MDTGRQSRRQFLHTGLVLTGLGFLVGCRGSPWQAPPRKKIARIGYLNYAPFVLPIGSGQQPRLLLAGLRELGWTEGEDFTVEYRSAEFRDERLPELAAELVNLGVDVIVSTSTQGALAAK